MVGQVEARDAGLEADAGGALHEILAELVVDEIGAVVINGSRTKTSSSPRTSTRSTVCVWSGYTHGTVNTCMPPLRSTRKISANATYGWDPVATADTARAFERAQPAVRVADG
jgi:hypothetical protein